MWNLTRALRLRFSAVRLNYLHFDNGQNNNLVVCHGLMGSHKNFRNICRNPLIASHANCYLVDARNHGDSPHTDSHTV
jgi:pimeloyl-ACP methyl ester carboxylesterase